MVSSNVQHKNGTSASTTFTCTTALPACGIRVHLCVIRSPRQLQNLNTEFEEVGDKRLSDQWTQLMRASENGARDQEPLDDMGSKGIFCTLNMPLKDF